MSQSSRQFKLNGKLQQKNHHKSSLPIIDPLHNTKSKFVNPSPVKAAFKNVRKISRNNQPASNIINGQVQGQNYEKKPPINQNEQSKSEKKILTNTKLAAGQNELNTATTIHIQEDINFKETDIKETELKGLDMWALNKNLKQFSQTRKVAFFKLNSQKQKNDNSSTVSKNRTQQIKSIYKIYGGNTTVNPDSEKQHSQNQRKIKKINQNMTKRKHSIEPHPYSTFSKTKIASPLGNTLYGTLPVRKHGSDLNTTLYMKQKKSISENKTKDSETLPSDINPYLRTFINGSHLKREPSSRKLQILELKNFTPKANQNSKNTIEKSKEKKPNNFRRNRFEKIQTDQTSGAESQKITNNKEQKVSKDSKKEKQNKAKNDQPLIISSEGIAREEKQNQAQEKKRQYEYHRSIQKISKSLLKNTEDYIDNYQTFSVMPSSKIQFFIDSLNHPEFSGTHNEYKSTYQGFTPSEVRDEFSFTEPMKSPQKLKGKNSHSSKNKQSKKNKGGYKN